VDGRPGAARGAWYGAPMGRVSIAVALVLVAGLLRPLPTAAQSSDLREIHELAVYSMVRIQAADGAVGTGWLLAQSGRPLIITNRHVAEHVGSGGRAGAALFYRGTGRSPERVRVRRFHLSAEVDLGILRLLDDPPSTARPIPMRTDTSVRRGERVVLGGNPSDGLRVVLPFQTTEGVVTGHVSGSAYEQCGRGRNCIVIDAASFRGSSGGPVFNRHGQIVGMLWGGPTQVGLATNEGGSGATVVQNPTFSYLIHVRVLADELRRLERDD